MPTVSYETIQKTKGNDTPAVLAGLAAHGDEPEIIKRFPSWHPSRTVTKRCPPSYLPGHPSTKCAGKHPYLFAETGQMDEGNEYAGGFNWTCNASFDEPPCAETLAFIECRLASDGPWMVHVPHQHEFVPEGIINLISGDSDVHKK